MKIALVHDYLTQFGGGERVLAALCEMFPEAPIFTLIYDEKNTGGIFKSREIHTSFLQKIPGSKKFFRAFIWLMPLAVEQFDLSGFDIVISVSHSFGKGIITKPGTKHICYCLTPTRYLWDNSFFPFKPFSQILLTYLRNWDYQAAQRPDYFIASSNAVKERIKKYYQRDSEVIYPPIETDKFYISQESKDYFLMVGRLVPYKRFDLAIDAFSKLSDEKLFIIGDGPEKKKLEIRSKKLVSDNIKFLGFISEKELSKYYANSKALIFPQEEDFGIVALEAMASGRPVIAFHSGGALETVIEKETGSFFNNQTAESLIEAVKDFDENEFHHEKIDRKASRFDKKIFQRRIKEMF